MQNNNKEREKVDKLDLILKQLKYNNQVTGYVIFRSFIVGIFTGLGATVGLAIVITILSIMVNWFGGLPVVGEFFIGLGRYLHK